MAASGDLVVAAHHLGGVVILGAHIPSEPEILATALQSAHAEAVELSGSQVLVADGPRGLVVIDVSDPASPWSPGLVAAKDYAWDVASSGGLALVAEGETGLVVVDASVRPPALLSRLDLPGEARTVAAEGSLAFVGAGNGLYVVDISDPEAPYERGSTDLRAPVLGVAVSGDRVLAALGDSGLQVIDVSEPGAPVVTDTVPGAALSVAVRGDLAWVAAGPVGVRVLDLSRRPPSVVGSADLGGSSVAVAPAGDVLWVADREGRVVAVDSPPCTRTE